MPSSMRWPNSPLMRDCTATLTPTSTASAPASRCESNARFSIEAVLSVEPLLSVEEMARSREVHGDARLLSGLDDELVAHRSTRLHDRADARLGEHLEAVGEREERVGRADRTGRALARTRDRELGRVDPVDLAHADTDGR